MTQKEIGRRLGLSQMHISRLLREAMQRLQREAA
jgi:DNA-directed RNA polymerase specialized sigma subunit